MYGVNRMNLFAEAAFWFFAVLGIIHFFRYLFYFAIEIFSPGQRSVVVVKVKNQQENIEHIIRKIVWDSLNVNNEAGVPDILVVDMGSTDDTCKILQKLKDEYDFIAVTDKEGYDNFEKDR